MVDTSLMENRPTIDDATGNQFQLIQFVLKKEQKHFHLICLFVCLSVCLFVCLFVCLIVCTPPQINNSKYSQKQILNTFLYFICLRILNIVPKAVKTLLSILYYQKFKVYFNELMQKEIEIKLYRMTLNLKKQFSAVV